MSEFNKIVRQSAIYGISTAFGRMLSLITAPILTRIFEPSDYGKIALVQIALGLAVIFAGFNIGSGVNYYYYHHEDEKIRRNVLSSGLGVVTILALFIALALFLSAEQINALLNINVLEPGRNVDLISYLKIGAMGVFFGIIMMAMQTILRIKQQPNKYAKVELFSLSIAFLLTILLVIILKLGILGVFWASVGGSFCGMLLAIFYVRHWIGRTVSLALLIPILAYSLPQMPGVLINWVQSQTGRIFINHYTSLTEQGLYSIAFTIAGLMMAVTGAFRLAYDPYFLSIMKRPDAQKKYASVFSGYTFGFGVLVALISSFAKPILFILTPPAYYEAHFMVVWLLAGGFLMGLNNILGVGIWITRKTKYTSYAQGITFLSVLVFSFLLVPKLGAIGAAIAYFIGSLTQSLAYFVFAQRLYYVPYRFFQTHLLLVILIILGLANSVFVDGLDFFGSIGVGGITFLLSSVILFYSVLSKSQREVGVLFSFNLIKKIFF